MIRSMRVVGLAALLTALPAALSAQSTRPISFGVSGGLSVPTGDLGDAVDAGYSVAGHVYFKPSGSSMLGFRGDVSFDRWAFKGNSDVSTRNLAVVANALLDIGAGSSSAIAPYVLGGVGLFNGKSSVNNSESSSEVGVQAGGGLRFKLSGFSTFVEAKYVNVFSDPSTGYIPITFGVRF